MDKARKTSERFTSIFLLDGDPTPTYTSYWNTGSIPVSRERLAASVPGLWRTPMGLPGVPS